MRGSEFFCFVRSWADRPPLGFWHCFACFCFFLLRMKKEKWFCLQHFLWTCVWLLLLSC